jgi:hypothetical protein
MAEEKMAIDPITCTMNGARKIRVRTFNSQHLPQTLYDFTLT